MRTVDVGVLLDEGRASGYQTLLIGATALAIILDGVDTQLLGNAIPALIRDWSLPRGAFTTVLALGPLGMMVGGAIGGILGDRIGRRTALLTSVLSFAVGANRLPTTLANACDSAPAAPAKAKVTPGPASPPVDEQ